MPDPSWLWAAFTLVAAAAQTVRNATQRGLTAELGTAGATHVRFLFGFPFALVFLAAVMLALGRTLPHPPLPYWPWVILGALAQIAATALMAAAILIATTGVVFMALKPGTSMGVKATVLGLAAGAMFALSAVGFRGAILSLGLPSYVMAATFTVMIGLLTQSALLSLYLKLRD